MRLPFPALRRIRLPPSFIPKKEPMTPSEVALAIAPQVRDGLVANSDNAAGYWLELLILLADFCQASIGEAASRQVVAHLNAECGRTLQ